MRTAALKPVSTAAVAGESVVRMTGVRFAWPGRGGFSLAIEELVLAKGERLLLLGPSGSGKSTLLSLLCGIVVPQAGEVNVLGTDLARLGGAARDRFRADHMGIIFQMFNLIPYASVAENVALPMSFSALRRQRVMEGGGIAAEVARLTSRLGLGEALMRQASAARLSVGQQQRIAAARALIGSPEVVIADEPTSSLDRARQLDFLELLFGDLEETGATLVMVSHDESLAQRFSRVERLDAIAKVDGEGEA